MYEELFFTAKTFSKTKISWKIQNVYVKYDEIEIISIFTDSKNNFLQTAKKPCS